MKKKGIFTYAGFCFILLFLMVPEVSAGWEDFEVLKYYFDIDAGPRHVGGAHVVYNDVDNEYMVLWTTKGLLRDDCDPDDDYECTNSFKSVNARSVSPDGEILGSPIQLSPPEIGSKSFARIAHSAFTNEYLIAFAGKVDTPGSEIHIARMDRDGGIQLEPTVLYPTTAHAGHTEIIFNPVRREFLVVYNDLNIFNEYNNNIGFTLDENGDTVQGPFAIGSSDALLVNAGAYYAPRCDYNPTDDTYFCTWEDFRNPGWDIYAPCDVYGALMDAEGNMIVETPVLDDAGMEGEGNQRVPIPIYNPDKNEFLILYKDETAGTAGAEGWLMGRIVGADGTLPGEPFLIDDHPRIQHWPDAIYVEDEKKYFMIWNDLRNDGEPEGTPFYLSTDIDIYGRWLDSDGQPIGDEVLIADAVEWQMTPRMAYNPVMKSFLIVWEDGNAPNDYEPIPPPPGTMMGGDSPNDLRGTLYGVPSETTIPQDGTGGCPAVAIYGTSAEETKLLRLFRDTVLNDIPDGQKVIDLYYALGPEVVKIMEENRTVKTIVKNVVDGMLPFVRAASP